MIKWIVDRKPEHGEGWDGYVWKFEHDKLRRIVRWNNVEYGEPWMPIEPPEPYMKPKRYIVESCGKEWGVKRRTTIGTYTIESFKAYHIHTREAAERIATIYEEVEP